MAKYIYLVSETGYARVSAGTPRKVLDVFLRSGYRIVSREEYRRHQRRVAARVRREEERRWRDD